MKLLRFLILFIFIIIILNRIIYEFSGESFLSPILGVPVDCMPKFSRPGQVVPMPRYYESLQYKLFGVHCTSM